MVDLDLGGTAPLPGARAGAPPPEEDGSEGRAGGRGGGAERIDRIIALAPLAAST